MRSREKCCLWADQSRRPGLFGGGFGPFRQGPPVVLVCPTGKLQEQLQQELETWLPALTKRPPSRRSFSRLGIFCPRGPTAARRRAERAARDTHSLDQAPQTQCQLHCARPVYRHHWRRLLQGTFSPNELKNGSATSRLESALIHWTSSSGSRTRVRAGGQVSQKGEIALRGGILDVFPLPARGRSLRVFR
ncbi:MAG: hypothetical protein Ct9H300mP32_1690 [Verrucomicrobiota bacterium]|nr:MAG: hypothetical protein Ct9H300mP32_1690 [Verrucomicrobiota bacterium]